MRSTFSGLEIAKRSLFTQQAALQTTGHNIANANTAGYSRQVVNMVASRPMEAPGLMHSTAPGQIGTGVEFSSITRIREKFLDDQYRNENKSFGSYSIQSDVLEKLETIINEPSDTGIRTVMDNFWKSWSDLSTNPDNVTGRKIVRENAIALADALNYTSKQLSDLNKDLTNNVSVKATEMNTITGAIANLNQEIQRIEGMGDDANDLRDQRDTLTDQLSKIVNITVQQSAQGYTINMGSTNLVTYDQATTMTSDALTAAVGTGDLSSGEVHGMVVARDRFVADYQKQMDTLANTIANGEATITIPEGSVLPDGTTVQHVKADGTTETLTLSGASRTIGAGGMTIKVNGLNGLHKLGYTLNNPLEKGGDFFVTNDGSSTVTAANFSVSAAIIDNPSKIASSMRTTMVGTTETVVQGNNTLASLMFKLKDSKFSFSSGGTGTILSNGTLNDYYASVVGQLGVQSNEAQRLTQNQQALVEQIEGRRQSVSGVSLDEEMANMIKFQHAYSAAARVMTTFDELLDKIVNGMGTGGR